MGKYIWQNENWKNFEFDNNKLQGLLLDIKRAQGYLFGKMDSLGFETKKNAQLKILTENIIKSSEIEGEILNLEQVKSSVARKLGIDVGGDVVVSRNIEGVVEMMIDATQNYDKPMTKERLIGWQAALFPTGYSGMYKIEVGKYRTDSQGPMQVISGSIGKSKIHYEAPSAMLLEDEMSDFIDYINTDTDYDLLIKAGIVHLWFVTLHPFEDGNGRVARAVTDMILARSDETKYRFYSMSVQIQKNRKDYYDVLEITQKNSMNITNWLVWFLKTLLEAIKTSDKTLKNILKKAGFWQKNSNILFNERQKKVLIKFMNDFEGNLTTTKWAKMCNCSQDSATNDINDLVKKGILQKQGEARATHYVLNDI
ncbi:MAG: Fic family protein [Candidatus Gastranaerophilales bacterium]